MLGQGGPKRRQQVKGKCASQQARVLRKFTDSCLANHLLKLLYVVSDLFIKDSFSYFLFPTGLLVHSYIPVSYSWCTHASHDHRDSCGLGF